MSLRRATALAASRSRRRVLGAVGGVALGAVSLLGCTKQANVPPADAGRIADASVDASTPDADAAAGIDVAALDCFDELPAAWRELIAAHRACAADADCIVVGDSRASCDCAFTFFGVVNRDVGTHTDAYLERARSAECAEVSVECDDYRAPSAKCVAGQCKDVSHLVPCAADEDAGSGAP